MAINLIDAARDNDTFALTGEGQQALLRLLASQKVSDTRAQEEAAIDAEASGHKPKKLAPWIPSGDRRGAGDGPPPGQ